MWVGPHIVEQHSDCGIRTNHHAPGLDRLVGYTIRVFADCIDGTTLDPEAALAFGVHQSAPNEGVGEFNADGDFLLTVGVYQDLHTTWH